MLQLYTDTHIVAKSYVAIGYYYIYIFKLYIKYTYAHYLHSIAYYVFNFRTYFHTNS